MMELTDAFMHRDRERNYERCRNSPVLMSVLYNVYVITSFKFVPV
jgi:hypothetical protein